MLAILRPGRCHNLKFGTWKGVIWWNDFRTSGMERKRNGCDCIALHSVKITLLEVDIFKACYHIKF
jgi:hypothetical protein